MSIAADLGDRIRGKPRKLVNFDLDLSFRSSEMSSTVYLCLLNAILFRT